MQQQRNQTYREIAGLSKLRLAIFTAVAVAGLVSSAHFIARSMRLPVANYIIILSHLWKNMPIPYMLKQLMLHTGRTDKKHPTEGFVLDFTFKTPTANFVRKNHNFWERNRNHVIIETCDK